jgi:hypothetical protein
MSVHTNPLDLVGSWKVRDAGGPPGGSLVLGDQFAVFRRCGEVDGDWLADQAGHFVSYADSADGTCARQTRSISVPWLDQATQYRIDGAARVLLNANGHVVARLLPGAHPIAKRNDDAATVLRPRVTGALRAQLAVPPALPPRLSPATAADIAGRWHALGPRRGDPSGYVQFDQSGHWTGSDGCNAAAGRYAVAAAGQFTITDGGPNGAVGCDVAPEMYWAEQVRCAGFDGHVLVLTDRHGNVLGRLARAP